MAMTATQQTFVALFGDYMKDARAEQKLFAFIDQRSVDDLRACLAAYFDADKYPQQRQRSRAVFVRMVLRAIRNDLYFALHADAMMHAARTPWQAHYQELRGAEKTSVDKAIDAQKGSLPRNQRAFVDSYTSYMTNKRVTLQKMTALVTALKPEDRQACVRIYVEISQSYEKGNAEESLQVFFVASYYALKSGGAAYAQSYKAHIDEDLSVWHTRFTSLRPEMQKELLRQIDDAQGAGSATKTPDKAVKTVPGRGARSGDDAASPLTDDQKQFVRLYRQYVDSRGDRKLMDAFQRSLLGRNGETLAGCVQVYLDDSAKHYGEPPSHHSSQIFFGTLSLAIAKGSAYYAYKVRSWIDAKGSLWNKRYLALDEPQYRTPLRTQIEDTIKAKGRLIDELKIAYYTRYQRDPDIAALRSFEPVSIPDQVGRLSNALSDVEVAVGARSVESFDKAFSAVAKVLDAKQERLALWVLVKHCRERAKLNARFRHLIYLFGVGRLYLSAIRKYPVSHKDGLNAEEQAWLFEAGEKNDRYFDDFAAQIGAAIWKRMASAGSPSTRKWRDPAEDEPDDAYAAMARSEGMLQVYSDRLRLTLTPLVEAAALRGAVEEAWLKHAQQVNAMGITIDAGNAGVTTIRVGQTIGNFFVLWWDGHNRTVYLQVNGFEQVVFECGEGRLAEIYRDHSFYGVVAENTQHLLDLIPFIWEILGFIPDLVSGGLLGLVKSIAFSYAFSYAFDKSMEALGIDPTKAQFFVLGASLLMHAARPKHASGSSAHMEGAVETKALGREVHTPATERPAVDILGTERTGTRADPSATRGLAGGVHRDAPHDIDVAVRAADEPKARPGATRADERQAAPGITDSDRGIQQQKEGVAANANKPLGSNAPGITNADRAVPGGQRSAAPQKYSDVTQRRVMQLQQEAQAQANRFTQEMDEAVEKEVALVAGAENQSRLVDARASDRGMPAANENAIVGSRGPVAPSRRSVIRQAQYVSQSNINPGAGYLIHTKTPVLEQKFNRSIRSGHHVYMYHDGKGRLLYVGKSGGVINHADWVQRLRAHMRSPWIGDARSVTVFYDLSEQEMWALEEVMIGRDPTDRVSGTFYALFNERPGEYTRLFGEQGLSANASSAMKKPSARFSFFADPLPR